MVSGFGMDTASLTMGSKLIRPPVSTTFRLVNAYCDSISARAFS